MSLKTFVNCHVAAFNKKPIKLLTKCLFFREENNPLVIDNRVFLSPAYGTVMGICKTSIDSDDTIINAKGVRYSLKDMVAKDKETVNYLKKFKHVYVCDIFMSFYDVHTNHVPYQGYQQRFKQLKPLKTRNAPMLSTEEAFFEGDLNKALGYTGKYLVNNQRAITQFYNSEINRRFYTVQLADDMVNCIVNFNEHQDIKLLLPGQKFGQIRSGSGCSLIIPCDDDFDVEPIVNIGDHVEGGIDALFKVSKLNGVLVNEFLDHSYNEEITDDTYYDKTEDLYDDLSFDELGDEE
jgi:phosphatidylserine decarboxylase